MSKINAVGVALAAIAIAAAGCGGNGLLSPRATAGGTLATNAAGGKILVKFKPGQSRQALASVTQRLGLRMVESIPQIGIQVLSGGNATAIAALRQQPEVLFAEANGIEALPPLKAEGKVLRDRAPQSGAPRHGGDPMIGDQWALAKINAQAAWAITPGDPKTVLAIVDTGVDYNHPDLAGHVIKGYDFANKDEDPMDGHSHGTHCAGIAAATAGNDIGIAGIAPKVTIMAVKVLSDAGSGTTEDVIKGILYAVDKGATVISLSLGGSGGQQAKQEAVDYALAHNVVLVAAMGNNGGNVQTFPGACKGAFAVGATAADDTLATFSNYGDWIGISAPGHKILSTIPGGGYQAYSGTSMATPYVAGLAALVRSQHPDWNHLAVRARIEKAAADLGDAGFDPKFGHGRIDAEATLK